VDGPVFLPHDAGYDRERVGYNLAIPQQPAVIVGATSARDVAAAVNFAAALDQPVSIQATGHGSLGPGAGAVLISTRRMTGLSIDPDARLARVEAGVRWQHVIDEAAKHGLAALNGSSPSVGVVSYTLGGGLGPLARAYGWAADRVRTIELVTADGRLRRVTAQQHADLFWALRGSKGNFGVVTALEFELLPISTIYAGGLYFPGEAALPVLHRYRRWLQTVPDEMTSSIALLRLPATSDAPAPLRGTLAVHVRISYAGSADDGERLLAPLRAIGPRIIDTVSTMPFAQNAAIHMDPVDPLPVYERTMALRDVDDVAIDTLLSLAGPDSDSPLILVELRHLGGALRRQPQHPNAVGNRGADYTLLAASAGPPDAAETITAYAEKILSALAPWGTGGRLLNFIGAVPPEQFRDAWEPPDYDRLAALKAVYDPANRFRVNVNIPPRPVATSPRTT
jgi:FAD/FMN-containing dehydrogenase